MLYKSLFDKVLEFFSDNKNYIEDIIAAKADYFSRTGKVFPDDPYHEARMTAFVEWFTLDRIIRRVGLTPVQYYLCLFENQFRDEEKTTLKNLAKSIHSLFIFTSRGKDSFTVKDLFDQREYALYEKRHILGIRQSNLFEGRLIVVDDRTMLMNAYCTHPDEMKSAIQSNVRHQAIADRRKFIDYTLKLAGYRVRCNMYKNVDPKEIYTFSSM